MFRKRMFYGSLHQERKETGFENKMRAICLFKTTASFLSLPNILKVLFAICTYKIYQLGNMPELLTIQKELFNPTISAWRTAASWGAFDKASFKCLSRTRTPVAKYFLKGTN